MITGRFDHQTAPVITSQVTLPAAIPGENPPSGQVHFRMATGAVQTCIHQPDALRLGLSVDHLPASPTGPYGVPGYYRYHTSPATLSFDDGYVTHTYQANILIVEPQPGQTQENRLSLLGQDILRNWHVLCDYQNRRLECTVPQTPEQ